MNSKDKQISWGISKAAVALMVAIAAMLAVWLATPAQALAKEFPDVPEGHWARTYVSVVSDAGVMTGYSGSGLFGAEDGITRGQVATMLFRAANPNSTATTTDAASQRNETGFSDVPNGQYYTAAMNWAKRAGIFTGDTGRNTVRPNDGITRQELAVVLFRRSGDSWSVGQANDSSKTYTHASDSRTVDGWAATGVDWCYAQGIMRGNPQTGALNPHAGTTRTQAAKMLAMSMDDLKAKVQSTCSHQWVDINKQVEVVDREAYDSTEPETVTSPWCEFNNGRCLVLSDMPKVLFVGTIEYDDGHRGLEYNLPFNLDQTSNERWVLDDRIFNAYMSRFKHKESDSWCVWWDICCGYCLSQPGNLPVMEPNGYNVDRFAQGLVDYAGLSKEEAMDFAQRVQQLLATSRYIGNYSDAGFPENEKQVRATATTGNYVTVHHEAETHTEARVVGGYCSECGITR